MISLFRVDVLYNIIHARISPRLTTRKGYGMTKGLHLMKYMKYRRRA